MAWTLCMENLHWRFLAPVYTVIKSQVRVKFKFVPQIHELKLRNLNKDCDIAKMLSNKLIRFIHGSSFLHQVSNKSLLAELRRKTGYTFSNCKKALELNENNLQKAEAWLNEQAQQLGWSKAEKLKYRNTSQGLVAVTVDKTNAAMIEVNCETDFVAKNKQFHGLADLVASAVMKHTKNVPTEDIFNRSLLDAEALKSLIAEDGKSIADHSALSIGTLGENISIRRALCLSVSPDIALAGCTHPASIESAPISCGKYGSLIAFKTADNSKLIGKQLCQHIIGMNPTKIGDPELDQPSANIEEESILIHQEFLLDPSITVQQFLTETQTKIYDFARFERGEMVEGQQNLDSIETAG